MSNELFKIFWFAGCILVGTYIGTAIRQYFFRKALIKEIKRQEHEN